MGFCREPLLGTRVSSLWPHPPSARQNSRCALLSAETASAMSPTSATTRRLGSLVQHLGNSTAVGREHTITTNPTAADAPNDATVSIELLLPLRSRCGTPALQQVPSSRC